MANKVLRGPTVEVEERAYPVPDLIDEIMDVIRDEGDADTASTELVELYADSSDEDRVAINNTLVAICGFGFPTLMRRAMADDDLMTALHIAEVVDDNG